MAGLFDNLSNVLNLGGNLALTAQGVSDVRNAGADINTSLSNLANQIREQSVFKPYSITTGTGTSTATPTGTTTTLSPELEQIRNKLLEGSSMFYDQTVAPIDQRAADITAQLEAATNPQRQRDYLALEERLRNQGRLGLSTAATGGNPEMFAFAKALEEQRAQNALTGRQQALGEQLQNFNIGQGMFGLSFTPQQQQLAAMGAAAPFAELATRVPLQGTVTAAQLAGQGAQAQSQANQLASLLMNTQLSGLLNAFTQPQQGGGSSIFSGLLSQIFGS